MSRFLIAVPYLSPGSGLSIYIFTLCRILEDSNEIAVLTTHDGKYPEFGPNELEKCGSGIKLISLGRHRKGVRYLKAIMEIRKFAPDFLINNYDGLVQMILPLIPRKTKIIHVLHNDLPDFYRVGALNGKYVEGWIAPTTAIAEHFNAYTKNRFHDRINVITHGVETALSATHKPGGTIEILYVGVLEAHKGVQYLFPIVEELLRRNRRFRLTIAGGGVLDEQIREIFAGLISRGIVQITGVIPHEAIYKHMANSDIFLYPTNCDAFGLVIAEAMINGMAPVVGHLKGITDNLIEDNVNGFLVEPHDVQGYIDKVDGLISSPELLSQIKEKAKRKAVESFSDEVMGKNYRSYFLNKSN